MKRSIGFFALVLSLGMVLTAAEKISAITVLHDMRLNTPLVRDGKIACVIAVPRNDAVYVGIGNRIADAIRAVCGIRPEVLSDDQDRDEECATRHVIALGLFANNAVLDRLYRMGYVGYDWAWPKSDEGWVLRSVHNPWMSGTNVIAVSSRTAAGVSAAASAFCELLATSQGTVPPILKVHSPDTERPSAELMAKNIASISAQTSSRSMGGTVAKYADTYFKTGFRENAELFLASMRRLDVLHAKEGDASDVRTCRYLHLQFDRIDEGPDFTPDERLELVNLFYRFATRMTYARRQGVKTPTIPHGNDWNAIGASYAGLYFSRYYPDLDIGHHILKNLDAYNELNMRYWKVSEDCPGYGDITLTGNYDWALARPDPRFFEGGNLRKMADYSMMITDNGGRPSGYGDSSGLGGAFAIDAYSLAAWIYRDGRYLWWFDRHGGRRNRFWVPPEVFPREEPTDLIGLRVAPLDEWIYTSRTAGSATAIPADACYDKVTFRKGLDADDAYLSVSGFCYGFHSHADANAIVRYYDRGSVRLYDDGYMIPTLSEHNTVTILKDGWTGRTPDLARVIAQADFPGIAFFSSRLEDYNGIDWDRTIIWPKGHCFVVFDTLRCMDEEDVYSFQCIWRCLGQSVIDGKKWQVTDSKGIFELLALSDAALSERESAGTSLNAKAMPPDRARALVQAAEAPLKPGEAFRFSNVFRTVATADDRMSGRKVSDTLGAVRAGDWQAFVGVEGGTPVPGVSVKAFVFTLDEKTLSAAGLSECRIGPVAVTSNKAIGMNYDMESGVAAVVAEEDTLLDISLERQQRSRQLDAGASRIVLASISEQMRQSIAASLTTCLMKEVPNGTVDEGAVQEQRMSELWRYCDFKAYADFSAEPGTVCRTSPKPLSADYVGYGNGDSGTLLTPGANIMFPAGETVTIDIELSHELLISRVVLNSRQLLTFREGCGLRKATLLTAPDGSESRLEECASLANTEDLQNAKMAYALPLSEVTAVRRLRLIVEPYSATHKVYLDSIQMEGIADSAQIAMSGFQVNGLRAVDLDNDGRDEIVAAGTDKTVHVVKDGKALWQGAVGEVVNAIAVPVDSRGRPTAIAAACDDHKLYFFGPDGSTRSTVTPPPRTYARAGYRGVKPFTGRLTVAEPGDLDGDGKEEVIVGSANWRCYAYSSEGELIWDECCWAHTPTCAAVSDLDGNGTGEVVMGNTYTRAVIYSSEGKVIGNAGGGGHAGPTALGIGDADGNGKGDVVVGDRNGQVSFTEFGNGGETAYQTGCEIADVVVADLDGDGAPETIAVSKNFVIYVFDSQRRPLRHRSLLTTCRDLAVGDVMGDGTPEILCACDDGTVRVLNPELDLQTVYRGSNRIRCLVLADLDGKGKLDVAVASDGGTLLGLTITRHL